MTTMPDTQASPLSELAGEQSRMLRRAAALLASPLEFGDALAHMLSACLPTLGDFGFVDASVNDGVRRTARAHDAPEIEALLPSLRMNRSGMNLDALTSGRSDLHAGIDDDWRRRVAGDAEQLAVLRQLAFHSMITVPIRYRDELIGALTLFMGRSGRRHRTDDLALAEELSVLAAPAVANARILEKQRHAEAALRQSEERLELLASAGSVFSQSLEPDDTLKAIASLLTPRLADWCRVDLVDASGGPQHRLTYHADPQLTQRGIELAQLWRAPASLPGSIAWVIANTSPSLNARITEENLDRIGNRAIAKGIRQLKLCASLCVPLVARGRTLGALSVAQAESGRGFSNEDLALLTELAQKAALALDNARLYADAEHARREAELANRAKDEFLAMLGHELRNPLAPIVTALELMELRGDGSTQYEQGVIARQVSHLSRLVDDLLDMSRIARGKVQLKLERLEIAAVIGKSVELVRPTLEKNLLRFELALPSRPLHLMGDAVRLTQVFGNLLNNAAKFTPAGGRVELKVTASAGELEVMVKDSGIGISPELLPQVFERFVQGPQHLDRQAGGLGLGLPIAKTFVAMHGGSIHAESMGPGTGSTFYVRLPCEQEGDAATAWDENVYR